MRLSDEEREEAIRNAEQWAAEDEKTKRAVVAKNNLEILVHSAKNNLGRDEVKDLISESERKDMKNTIRETLEWLEANQDEEADVYEDKMKEVRTILSPILSQDDYQRDQTREDEEDSESSDEDFGEL